MRGPHEPALDSPPFAPFFFVGYLSHWPPPGRYPPPGGSSTASWGGSSRIETTKGGNTRNSQPFVYDRATDSTRPMTSAEAWRFNRLFEPDLPLWPDDRELTPKSQICELKPGSCKSCGCVETIDVPLHGGQTIRRDCSQCGAFIGFPRWRRKPG